MWPLGPAAHLVRVRVRVRVRVTLTLTLTLTAHRFSRSERVHCGGERSGLRKNVERSAIAPVCRSRRARQCTPSRES